VSFADFLQQRDGPRADEVRLDLRGIALGNAWIDPYHQYDVSRYAHARGLITEGQVHSLRHAERACQRKLDAKQWYSKQCWDLLDTVIDDSGQKGRARVSMYDSRNFPKSASDFPPGHLDIERYMSTKAVRDALHANRGSPGGGSVPSKFKECTDPPYMALQHQDGLGVMRELARVLEKGEVDVLFYNGQYDVICNHLSSEKALGMLEWSGSKKYRAAPHTVWWSDTRKGGGPAGYAKASGPLTLLLVNDAGHMVPLDLPEIALEMVSRLISRRGFADQQQKIPDDGKGGAIASDCSRAEPEARALGEAGPSNATDNDDDLADAAPQGLSTSDEILWLRAENLRLRQALEVQVDSTGQ
jgi:carboxypeptidase D